MLSARRAAALMGAIGVTVMAVMALLLGASQARADTDCPPGVVDCDVTSEGSTTPTPGNSGTNGGGGGGGDTAATCTMNGETIPCYRDDLGWWNATDKCYWELADPQPTADSPVWVLETAGAPADWEPGDGAFYNVSCPGQPLAGGTIWRQDPPPGFGGGPNLEALAAEAITKMRLLGADVGIAPKPGSKGGSVGLPVWVWNQESPRTTGPTSASATALGVTVTATATVQNVVWNFGNGTSTSCAFPGKEYVASYGAQVPEKSQGECGFAGYDSKGEYAVTATTTWAVHWAGGGQQGDLTTTRTSQVQIRIGEVQVVGQ